MFRKLRILSLVCTSIFFTVSMILMLFYSSNKIIVIADVSQDAVESQTKDSSKSTKENRELKELAIDSTQKVSGTKSEYLCVPLPKGTSSEQVKMENHYMEKELWIHISDVEKGFYEKEAVFGNLEQVVSAGMEYNAEGIWLKFDVKDYYDYNSVLENDKLYVEFGNPREIFQKIIVIDPGHGGEDLGNYGTGIYEKDITLSIAERLKQKLDETDIKVYYTRMEDSNPSAEDRIEIANSVNCDMFISIHVNKEIENENIYGIEAQYNSNFFIPVLGSIELADIIEREVVTSVVGKGLGLFPADENNFVIWKAQVPAVMIEVGYLSNAQEGALLQKDTYIEKIATGIFNGIMKAYDVTIK